MNNPSEQILASTQAAMADFSRLATAAFSGFEKLAEINMTAAKAVLADSQAKTQAMLSVKSPAELAALQKDGVQPLVEQATAYSRSVYEVATQTGAEIGELAKEKFVMAQETMAAGLEQALKNAPEGSEAAVAVIKNAMAAGQSAFDNVQASAKKTFEQAEKNFANAANVATAAVKPAKAAAKAR